MPVSRDIIPIYDEPPVARYPSSNRMPSVQYLPDGSNGAQNGAPGAAMGSRRRSWQDLVAESETATVSDASITNYSFGEGSMGNRRQSWMNLMDSDENLHKTGREKVSTNPSGGEPQAAKRGMRIVTVSDNGRFQREPNLSQTNSMAQKSKNSSRASTPSEFILVPKSYPSAGSLPRKSAEPENSATAEKTHDFGLPTRRKTQNEPPSSSGFTCPCSAKRALLILLLAVILIAIGITNKLDEQFVKHEVYKLQWWSGSNGQGTVELALDIRNEESAVFNVEGWPFTMATTYVDFDKKHVIAIDPALDDYCFAMYLNTSALRDVEALVNGAKEAQKEKVIVSSEWPEDWHWTTEILPDHLKDGVLSSSSSSDEKCKEGARVLWLDWVYEHQKGQKCPDCHQVCLPTYGIRQEKLSILRRQCFWIFNPKWNQYANENQREAYQERFNAFYNNNNRNINPSRNSNRNNNHGNDNDDGWLSVHNPNGAGRTLRDHL